MKARGVFEYGFFIVALGYTLSMFLPIGGWLGHDYYYSFIRLFIGAVHFWRNFPSLPHYTPSLCGGIPFFADPQSVYFSLPQLFTFFIDPVYATFASLAIFYALGYWGGVKFFNEVCGYGRKVAHLGSLAFLLNGFGFAHLFAGHLTHHSYPIFFWLLYFLFKPHGAGRELMKAAAGFVLIITYMFYGGTFHMLVVFMAVLALSLPVLIYRKQAAGELAQLARFFGLVTLGVALTCSGKFAASFLFSKNFVHSPVDTSGQPVWELVFKYFWFDPHHTPLYIKFGKYSFGPWEYVGYLSRFYIPILLMFPFLALRNWDRRKLCVLVAYALLVPLLCVIASGSSWNELIPFIRRYHNPIKLLGAFVPFIVWVFAYTLSVASKKINFSSERTRFAVFSLIAVSLMMEHFGYAQYFLRNKVALGYVHSPDLHTQLKEAGGISPVARVVEAKGRDINGLQEGCTSLKCYEPLFGYLGENMKADLVVGPTRLIRDGKFNLNHPGCLLYPDYFQCKAWDRIPESDRDNFEAFIQGKVPEWGVPLWQNLLLYLNAMAVLGLFLPFFNLNWSWRGIRLPIPTEEGAGT